MQNAAQGISAYADLTIVGPRGCRDYAPPCVSVVEVPAGLAPFLLFGTIRTIATCRQHRFDVIVGGSGLTALTLRLVSRLFRIPSVVFIHGLDIVANSVVYQKLFVPAVNRASLIIANSQNTKRLAMAKGAARPEYLRIRLFPRPFAQTSMRRIQLAGQLRRGCQSQCLRSWCCRGCSRTCGRRRRHILCRNIG